MPGLEVIIAGVMMIALTLYVLLAGADFGAGVWELLASGKRAEEQSNLIAEAIGPIWEANHVWLILVIVLLFTAFPLAFVSIMTALFVPLMLLLIGIVIRGATFTFLIYDSQTKAVRQRWGSLFAIASIVSPIMLGICIGAVASGRIIVENGIVQVDMVSVWIAPFPWVIGLMTLAIFAYLAAVYLTVEADDPALKDDFRQRGIISSLVVIAMGLIALLLMESGAPRILEGLLRSLWAIPLHLGALLSAVGVLWALWNRRFYLARLLAIIEVTLILWGWGAAQYPYLVEPNITIQGAAAPQITLRLVLISLIAGSLLLFPSIYYLLRIFKGRKAALYRSGG